MSGHTPGPWSVVELPHTGLIGVKRGDRVLNLDQDQEPDANLIAAAPDLLEALESAAGWLEWLDDPRSGLGDDHKKVIKQARAAIAKARGQS